MPVGQGGNAPGNELDLKGTDTMWKVVITEIQDANTIDPASAPPGAFFVSTERFAQTVDHLDLPRLISVINRTPCSFGHVPAEWPILSGKIPRLKTDRLVELCKSPL
jgi:hypothetical protein